MAEFEADDIQFEQYDFEPKRKQFRFGDIGHTYDVLDYTGVAHDRIFLANKRSILDDPRPSWIPEFSRKELSHYDFLPPAVPDGDGNYFVATILDSDSLFTAYRLPADVLAASMDYYIKLRKAEIQREADEKSYDKNWVSRNTRRVHLPRGVRSMPRARFDVCKTLLNFVPDLKEKAGKSIRESQNLIFCHYKVLLDDLKIVKNDMNYAKQDYASTFQTGRETSYGDSGCSNALLNEFGVLIKKQNGSTFSKEQRELLSDTIRACYDELGDMSRTAADYGLKISYADNVRQHASKAVGIFFPYYQAIGVSFFNNDTKDCQNVESRLTLVHEMTHWLDYMKGRENSFRYASDNFNTLENKIAKEFRRYLTVVGDYWNRTCECLARAVEQHYAMSLGIDENEFRQDHKGMIGYGVFGERVRPLVRQLIEENKKIFGIDPPEPGMSSGRARERDLPDNDKMITYTSAIASNYVKGEGTRYVVFANDDGLYLGHPDRVLPDGYDNSDGSLIEIPLGDLKGNERAVSVIKEFLIGVVPDTNFGSWKSVNGPYPMERFVELDADCSRSNVEDIKWKEHLLFDVFNDIEFYLSDNGLLSENPLFIEDYRSVEYFHEKPGMMPLQSVLDWIDVNYRIENSRIFLVETDDGSIYGNEEGYSDMESLVGDIRFRLDDRILYDINDRLGTEFHDTREAMDYFEKGGYMGNISSEEIQVLEAVLMPSHKIEFPEIELGKENAMAEIKPDIKFFDKYHDEIVDFTDYFNRHKPGGCPPISEDETKAIFWAIQHDYSDDVNSRPCRIGHDADGNITVNINDGDRNELYIMPLQDIFGFALEESKRWYDTVSARRDNLSEDLGGHGVPSALSDSMDSFFVNMLGAWRENAAQLERMKSVFVNTDNQMMLKENDMGTLNDRDFESAASSYGYSGWEDSIGGSNEYAIYEGRVPDVIAERLNLLSDKRNLLRGLLYFEQDGSEGVFKNMPSRMEVQQVGPDGTEYDPYEIWSADAPQEKVEPVLRDFVSLVSQKIFGLEVQNEQDVHSEKRENQDMAAAAERTEEPSRVTAREAQAVFGRDMSAGDGAVFVGERFGSLGETVDNVTVLGKGIYEVTLAENLEHYGVTYLALSSDTADRCSRLFTAPAVPLGDGLVYFSDKSAEPYIRSELIEKGLCQAPSEEYRSAINDYVKEHPIQVERMLYPSVTCENFFAAFRRINELYDGKGDFLGIGQRLLNLADKKERDRIGKVLKDEYGCTDSKRLVYSLKKLLNEDELSVEKRKASPQKTELRGL